MGRFYVSSRNNVFRFLQKKYTGEQVYKSLNQIALYKGPNPNLSETEVHNLVYTKPTELTWNLLPSCNKKNS